MFSAKTYVVLGVALYALILIKADEDPIKRRCNRSSDCEPDECCVHLVASSAICAKRRQEGQECSLAKVTVMGERLHLYHCPCEDGLECRAGNIEVKEERKIYHDVQCRKPSS